MKEEENKQEENLKEDIVLTEDILSQNIAKSNEESISSFEKLQNKKSRKQIFKKKPFIIGTTVFVVLLLGLFGFLLLGSHTDEEKLSSNFAITSIVPKTKGNYISNNETFVVKTSVANEEILRNHLYVEPAVNYDIKEINSREYEVSLKNVPSDSLVNLSLIKNEVKSYSWAFQSTKDLKVLSIYPSNGSSAVSTSTGISVVLSYRDVENFEDHFTISPKVEGDFVHNGRTWKFIPKENLKDKTTYTITITSGLKAGDYVLDESVTTNFSTYDRPQSGVVNNETERLYRHSFISADKINTFTPNEQITFKMMLDNRYPIKTIKMYKFNTYNDFMKFLNNENDYKTTSLGEQPFTKIDKYYSYVLNNKFDVGYYAEEIYLSNGELYATIPVQVNKLSAFMFAADDDLLVWVGSGDSLLKDIDVSYAGKSYKTDNDGVAVIKKYNDESSKMKYINVGDKTTPLVIGIDNFKKYDYPEAYIYTDKPMYKNTDTISIWGYIPIKFYTDLLDDYNKGNFSLTINEENVPITINEDGTFTTKYSLDNHMDTYLMIELSYKDCGVAYRYVDVKNYSKQNYEYDIIMDNNYVKAGKNFDFVVHVNHVSGIDVQNKTITASYDGKVYTSTTDSSGNAKFSLPTKATKDDSGLLWQYVTLNIGDSEYNENELGFNFYIVNHVIVYKDNYYDNYDSKNKTSNIQLVLIDPDKKVDNIDYSNYYDLLKIGDYNGKVTVKLYEQHYQKVFSHSYYNEFTEEKEDVYDYKEVSNKVVESNTINVVDGKVIYKVNYDLKKSSDSDNYYYHLEYTVNYKNEEVKHSVFIYDYSYYEYKQYGQNIDSDFWRGFYGSDDYNYYRYFLTRSKKDSKYSIGDFITYSLNSFNGSTIGKDSKVLRVLFKNKILDKKILNTDSLDYSDEFISSFVPGVGQVGALFKDGKFYRFPSYFYDYNENDSKLNIEISSSKEKYSPGDTVKLTITTKDQNGKGIRSKVNVSVVDKAIFNVIPDSTYIVENVYSDIGYRAYTYSTYRDFELGMENGGAGDTGGNAPRTKFSDTVYFKELETDENGNLELEFKLNDSVTTFVTTVHAANKDGYVGVNKKEIVSTVPLAISVVEPNGLKEADDAVISANSIGDVQGDVNYLFELVGTDKKIEKKAKVGVTVYANFGHLEEGEYNVKVTATSQNNKDSVQFPFMVKKTQQEISVKAISTIKDLKNIKPTKNPIVLEFYKADFSTYMKYLDIIVGTNQDRLDTKVAYYKGLDLENKYYGNNYPINISDMEKFNDNGVLKYLENDNPSYEATALVNYLYPKLYELDKDKFYKELDDTDSIYVALDNILVLASMKQPVLDELRYIKNSIPDDQGLKVKLALAFIFVGDYDSAKEIYKTISNTENNGIRTIVSTFIDKENAAKNIDTLYKNDVSDRYVYFAMLSYFLNNESDLSRESTIKVSYGSSTKEVKLKGLMMKKLVINNKDLETLKITSDDDNDKINYYYEGGISEIEEKNIKNDLSISMSNSNISLGQTVSLNIDLSKFKDSGNLKIYLPNSLRLAGSVDNAGVYLSANRGEYLVLYVSETHGKKVSIPLYVTYPGKYKIEEIILKNGDTYHISNSLDVNIK